MRILPAMLALLLTLSGAARAQTAPPPSTPITRDQANVYYQHCLTQPADPRMTTQGRTALCACNAAQIMQTMSAEDFAAMNQDGKEGQEAFAHFLLNVYAPCMTDAVRDIAEGQCIQTPNLAQLGLKINQLELCRCTGRKAGQWFAENGRDLMSQLLREAPDTVNPFEPVMNSPAMRNATYDSMTACTRGEP